MSTSYKTIYGKTYPQYFWDSVTSIQKDLSVSTYVAIKIAQGQLDSKEKSLLRRYDTYSSIVTTASKSCANIRIVTMGLITGVVPASIVGFVQKMCEKPSPVSSNETCPPENGLSCAAQAVTPRGMLFLALGILLAFIIGLFWADMVFYKRQAVYRVLKEKVDIDIDLHNYEDTIDDEDKKYEMFYRAENHFFYHELDPGKLFKESIPFILMIAIIVILFALVHSFFK